MPQTIKRKCEKCKDIIIIDKNDIGSAVLYKNKYYHKDCFVALAKERAANKTSSSLSWQIALDNIEDHINEGKQKSLYQFAKDDLNEWILTHYDVTALPNRFWNIVAELEHGIYNKKKCKPIPVNILLDAWRWSQKNLDSINRKNKQNKKGPKTDIERSNYDLSIVVQHIPDYLKAKAKRDAEEAERQAKAKENIKIDYNNINNTPAKAEGLDDISDLLDEF